MLGCHLNEEKMTRHTWEELKQFFDGGDFELGAVRRYGLREKKDNQFWTFSSDQKKVIKFSTYEDTRFYFIEHKTKLLGDEKLKASVW